MFITLLNIHFKYFDAKAPYTRKLIIQDKSSKINDFVITLAPNGKWSLKIGDKLSPINYSPLHFQNLQSKQEVLKQIALSVKPETKLLT
jgi:hypothetical protein